MPAALAPYPAKPPLSEMTGRQVPLAQARSTRPLPERCAKPAAWALAVGTCMFRPFRGVTLLAFCQRRVQPSGFHPYEVPEYRYKHNNAAANHDGSLRA